MKNIIFFTALSFFAPNSLHAKALTSSERCIEKVRNVILQTAKIMGLRKKIGMYLDEPNKKDKNSEGIQLYTISSGPFTFDEGKAGAEGYLVGTGASATVFYKGNSCEIISLTVNIGN